MRAGVAGLLLLCTTLCACSGVISGHPKFNSEALLPQRQIDEDRDPAASDHGLSQDTPTSCAAYDDDKTELSRNECLTDLQTIIDRSYREYELSLNREVSGANFLLSVGTLGVTTAGTATGSTTAKTVLSAIATGLTGVRAAVSEDILYKSSVQTLILQMKADRARVGTRIENNKRRPMTVYTMSDARRDLIDYYYAGTIVSALSSNSAQTGARAKDCETAQDAAAGGATSANVANGSGSECYAITAAYNYGNSGKAIEAIFLKDGKIDTVGADKIDKCMKKLKLNYTPIYLINGAPDEVKNQVLGCLAAS